MRYTLGYFYETKRLGGRCEVLVLYLQKGIQVCMFYVFYLVCKELCITIMVNSKYVNSVIKDWI